MVGDVWYTALSLNKGAKGMNEQAAKGMNEQAAIEKIKKSPHVYWFIFGPDGSVA